MEERQYPRLGERVYEETLDNGLTVLVVRRRDFTKKFAFFATKYGGMDMNFRTEEGALRTPAGVAHFLEHKLFDTKDGNALQTMSENGANPNAFTAFDMTGYYFQCTEKFEENLRILLDFVTDPYFTEESVAKEQGIIGQEIAMGEDEADVEVFYDLLGCLYDHHPVTTHIAGSVDSIAAITPEVLYRCHRAFYDPANMVLTVVGDVEPQAVVDIAREMVKGEGHAAPARDYGPPESALPARRESRRRMEVATPLFQLGFKLPAEEENPLRAQLLGDLAGDVLLADSAPLYQRLYDEGLLTRAFSYGYERYTGAAFFTVRGESRDPEAVRAAILAECGRVAREGVEEALFRRLKRAAYGGTVSAFNSFEHMAIELCYGRFIGSDALRFPEEFQTITAQEVGAFIAAWFQEKYAAMAVILPGGEKV